MDDLGDIFLFFHFPFSWSRESGTTKTGDIFPFPKRKTFSTLIDGNIISLKQPTFFYWGGAHDMVAIVIFDISSCHTHCIVKPQNSKSTVCYSSLNLTKALR